MIDILNLRTIFAEKLLKTGNLDDAFIKVVWIAYKAGIADATELTIPLEIKMKVGNDTAEDQDILRKFVEREVIYNVSYFMSQVMQNQAQICEIFEEDVDEVFSLFSQDDWEGAARDCNWRMNEQGQIHMLEGEDSDFDFADSWQEACDLSGAEPYRIEAYEHYIVSRWFADRLKEESEIVGDFAGMTIWGRTCSGQAILLDSVVAKIYNDMKGN